MAPQALDFALFSAHPLAVRVDERYYVRSIQQANEDLSLTFYCAVENGIVLTAMSTGPLLPNLEAQFRRLHERLGPPLLTIGCDCFCGAWSWRSAVTRKLPPRFSAASR